MAATLQTTCLASQASPTPCSARLKFGRTAATTVLASTWCRRTPASATTATCKDWLLSLVSQTPRPRLILVPTPHRVLTVTRAIFAALQYRRLPALRTHRFQRNRSRRAATGCDSAVDFEQHWTVPGRKVIPCRGTTAWSPYQLLHLYQQQPCDEPRTTLTARPCVACLSSSPTRASLLTLVAQSSTSTTSR